MGVGKHANTNPSRTLTNSRLMSRIGKGGTWRMEKLDFLHTCAQSMGPVARSSPAFHSCMTTPPLSHTIWTTKKLKVDNLPHANVVMCLPVVAKVQPWRACILVDRPNATKVQNFFYPLLAALKPLSNLPAAWQGWTIQRHPCSCITIILAGSGQKCP